MVSKVDKVAVSQFIARMKVHSKRRVTVPIEVCKKWDLKDGDHVIFFYDVANNVCIKKQTKRGRYVVRD